MDALIGEDKMSYIRATSKYKYVDEENKGDYVFWSSSCGTEIPEFIEDYGSISDATLVEFFARILYNQPDFNKEDLYYVYLMDKLSKRLNVKLKPEFLETKVRFTN